MEKQAKTEKVILDFSRDFEHRISIWIDYKQQKLHLSFIDGIPDIEIIPANLRLTEIIGEGDDCKARLIFTFVTPQDYNVTSTVYELITEIEATQSPNETPLLNPGGGPYEPYLNQ